MTTPAAQRLGERLRELHAIVEELREAEHEAIVTRHTANVAEWSAFLAAEGAETKRKFTARLEVAAEIFAAEVAEAKVRHLVRALREADKRVDVGRTYSADLRAELKTLGMTEETAT
jgi:NifB/MoaA-like Fe-S oxidoreductase